LKREAAVAGAKMNRRQVIKALAAYAKENGLEFEVDVQHGKGSHYWVRLGSRVTTVQHELTPGKVDRLCKQLGIRLRDLR
jgi:hypothetical protein